MQAVRGDGGRGGEGRGWERRGEEYSDRWRSGGVGGGGGRRLGMYLLHRGARVCVVRPAGDQELLERQRHRRGELGAAATLDDDLAERLL